MYGALVIDPAEPPPYNFVIWDNRSMLHQAEGFDPRHARVMHHVRVAGMEPVNAADFLLHLRDSGRIDITLFNESPSAIGCKITELKSE